MEEIIDTNRRPGMWLVELTIYGKQPIVVTVRDASKPNTYYFKYDSVLEGRQRFFIRMPMSPETSVFEIYNPKKGRLKDGMDTTFIVENIEKKPLPVCYTCFDFKDERNREFIKFAMEFSERKGILSADYDGCIYTSDGDNFSIRYFDQLRDGYGNPSTASMRVNSVSGEMQISKLYADDYAVPECMEILSHEYCHKFINKDIANESEADLNGLLIVLGLGFPRNQCLSGWLKVFKRSSTMQNYRRHKLIEEFITDFDKDFADQMVFIS
jgi:hypothetical protein